MRYNIDGWPPYYANLSEARKAATMKDESECEIHNGDLIMGVIKNEDMEVMGVVTKRTDLEGFFYVDFKKEMTFEINDDGSVPNVKDGIRTRIDGRYTLQGTESRTSFNTLDDMIKAFIHKSKKCSPVPFSYQTMFEDGTEIGKIFTDEKGHFRLLEPNGKVRKISQNGKIGEFDNTVFFKDGSLYVQRQGGMIP